MTIENPREPVNHSKIHVLIGITLSAVVLCSIIGYYLYKTYFPSTDDAYVGAPLINVIPKVSGNIKHIYVRNNQSIKKGELLFDIDSTNYNLQLQQAHLDLLMAEKEALTAKQQMINAQSNVSKAKSNLIFAKQMSKRYTYLYQQKAGSQQSMQKFLNDLHIAQKEFDQSKVILKQATVQYEMSKAKINLAKLQVKNATLTNSYTKVYSPVNGFVTDMNLKEGQLVGTGEKLFGLVDNSEWWVDANFKETALYRIKPNQKVKIKIDMYPHTYTGYVESISHASGSTFALLPAQNATGNWIKVVQRFTVRISLKDDPKFPLRVGASTAATIDTTHS